MEHTVPIISTITNGNVCDFHSLPSESVAKTIQQQENHLLPQRKGDDAVTTEQAPQAHSTGVDTVVAKKVTTVQAHVRGYLTRKHLEPLKAQTRAATTIQAYWYILKCIVTKFCDKRVQTFSRWPCMYLYIQLYSFAKLMSKIDKIANNYMKDWLISYHELILEIYGSALVLHRCTNYDFKYY